ncbi:MAG: protein kinase [Planctomycetes bacterium]|nr:protein kinase [Planctomycetota bacterium]
MSPDLNHDGLDERDGLDAGLRAAFGPRTLVDDSCVAEGPKSIVETLGLRSRLLLRDAGDSPDPVINPRSPELTSRRRTVGRYQVFGEIARGGVGVVMKGRDVDLGREVAMKILLSGHGSNPAMVQRFMEEAQVTGQLQHPGILPIYEFGLQEDQRPFFTMKLVKGRTLHSILQDRTGAG